MRTPTEFSYRKFKRKADKVGYREATLAATELASRRVILWPIVDWLYNRGTIPLLSHDEFQRQLTLLLNVTDETEPYGNLTAPFVASMGPGYVLTETGLVTTDDGRILNTNLFPPEQGRRFVIAKLIWQFFFQNTGLSVDLFRQNIKSLDARSISANTVVPLIPRYIDNYYHWMIETVPTIRYLETFEQKTEYNVTYLIPGEAPSWLYQTLNLLEIPESKIEQASCSVYKCDQVILPSFPLQASSDYEWIVSRILRNAAPDRKAIGAGNNVFISRSNAVERRIVNDDEVMDTLSEYGFERYLLENNTVEENSILFKEADIIVGAHGAGLTDLIYCDGATVIEIFGSKVKNPYRRLAETMNVRYESLQCTPESTDIFVETDRLISKIESIL